MRSDAATMETVHLLERQDERQRLRAALDRAMVGSGSVVLIGGEAGIGKTSLLEAFADEARAVKAPPRIVWGTCDALFTPRPFGPFHDIAAQGLPELESVIMDPNRAPLFARVLALLGRVPTVAVIEDAQWADEATLDLLLYAGRRAARASILLIVTYRDDELAAQHPFRNVLGILAATPSTQRISLSPLSLTAVQTLAAPYGVDAATLHTATGGNPFFIAEALADPAAGVPATVRDAVLARAARLSASGRAVLDAAAVIGPRVEPWLLTAVTGVEATCVDECLEHGLLHGSGSWLVFRHDLTRQAVLDALSPHRRLVLHRLTLDALRASPGARNDATRLAHHAEAAEDPTAILAFAPAAGRAAAQAGAQREAAALYALALRFAQALPPQERAAIYEAQAEAFNHQDDRAASLQAWRSAQAIWETLGDPLRVGACRAQCAMQLNGIGRTEEADRECQAALDVLEPLPAGRELALAYRVQAGLRMLTQDFQEAIAAGERAIVLAEAADAPAIRFGAQNAMGSAWIMLDYAHGRQLLEQNLREAHAAGYQQLAALTYANLSSAASELYRFDDAIRYFADGTAYVVERGFERFRLYLLAWQTHTLLRLGHWAEAERVATDVIARPNVSVTSRITVLAMLGLVRARRGDPNAQAPLDEALALSRDLLGLHRLGLVRAARAEAAWLAGDVTGAADEARALAQIARDKRHPWFAAELLYWLDRCGERAEVADWLARPYALQLAGDWRAAAAAWRALGCPYEEARALADGNAEAQTTALEIFDRLGAQPMANRLRDKIRDAGGVVPRGPRASTRSNPFGLTARQREIWELLVEGLTNAEIAARLHLSAKTVDHHVSATLAKLKVSSRGEAAEVARKLSSGAE